MKSKGENNQYYLYILKNDQNDLYIGQTNNLEKRLQRHNQNDGALFTKNKPEFKLVYSEPFTTLKQAMNRELQIKKWSRAKKEALISGDLVKLKEL